jgi:proliferating cell nuclear antigen
MVRVLEISTVQATAVRILVEALKEILIDANFEFTKEGIRIMKMDSSSTVLVHLRLHADNFESYFCDRPRILGINMFNLFKLIRTIGNDDILTLYYDDSKLGVLGIRIENGSKNQVTNYSLNLMEIDIEKIDIESEKFESEISMPSADFQKIIKDIAGLSDTIDIKSVGNKLMFSCEGDFASQDTEIGETQNGITFTKNSDKIIQGKFSSKHLVSFTKFTNLCNTIQIYIKNDYPIIIQYACASLGTCKLALAPKFTNNN